MNAPLEILVLGDSHAEVFRDPLINAAIPDVRFDVVAVGGATVSGLSNPNPSSRAMPIFREALARSEAPIVLTLLGEVDTGFVIWYRAQKYGLSVSVMLDQALDRYQALLSEIAKGAAIVWISAPLPTIRDDTQWGEVANARREVTATQSERTALTVRFNAAMTEHCAAAGHAAINLDALSCGADGLVRDSLRNRDPGNHHYNRAAYADLLRAPLTEAIERLGAG